MMKFTISRHWRHSKGLGQGFLGGPVRPVVQDVCACFFDVEISGHTCLGLISSCSRSTG